MRKYQEIRYVPIPKSWEKSHCISREEGTRWYTEKGGGEFFDAWIEDIHGAHLGLLIPLQWVPAFVGVSRSAVYQRAKAGGLTVFSYVVVEPRRTILGALKEEIRERYDLVPVSECKQWQRLLYDRANKVQGLTGKEVDMDDVADMEEKERAYQLRERARRQVEEKTKGGD